MLFWRMILHSSRGALHQQTTGVWWYLCWAWSAILLVPPRCTCLSSGVSCRQPSSCTGLYRLETTGASATVWVICTTQHECHKARPRTCKMGPIHSRCVNEHVVQCTCSRTVWLGLALKVATVTCPHGLQMYTLRFWISSTSKSGNRWTW